MATYYISNNVSNGYSIGVDSNSGTSKSLPFLTWGKAKSVCTDGDIIIFNDGTYLSTDGAYGGTSFVVNKLITISCENIFCTTIKGTNATQILEITPDNSGTITVDNIIIDANNASARCCTLTARTATIVANIGCWFKNPTTFGLHSQETDISVNIFGAKVSATSMAASGRGINIASLASGVINIEGLEVDINSSANGYVGGVEIKSTSGIAVSAIVKGVTGKIEGTGSGTLCLGISIRNIPSAIAEENNDLIIKSIYGSSSYGIRISTSGGIQSDNCIIRNNKRMHFLCPAGYGIIIGESSGNPTENNKCNNGKIYGNSIVGIENGKIGTPHGIVMGVNTGGSIYNNISENFSPTFLLAKTDSTTKAYNNISINPYGGQGLYAKGCNQSSYFNNLTVFTDSRRCDALACQVHSDDSTPCTNVNFCNNLIIYLDTSSVAKFVRVDATSSAIFAKNVYYHSGVLDIYAFEYAGLSYSSFSEWFESITDTSLISDPLLIDAENGDYHLQPTSPCIGAGTSASLITTDIEGNTLFPPYNIGPYGVGTGLMKSAIPGNPGQVKYKVSKSGNNITFPSNSSAVEQSFPEAYNSTTHLPEVISIEDAISALSSSGSLKTVVGDKSIVMYDSDQGQVTIDIADNYVIGKWG